VKHKTSSKTNYTSVFLPTWKIAACVDILVKALHWLAWRSKL